MHAAPSDTQTKLINVNELTGRLRLVNLRLRIFVTYRWRTVKIYDGGLESYVPCDNDFGYDELIFNSADLPDNIPPRPNSNPTMRGEGIGELLMQPVLSEGGLFSINFNQLNGDSADGVDEEVLLYHLEHLLPWE